MRMSSLGYTKGYKIKQNVEFPSSAYKRIRKRIRWYFKYQ